MPRGARIAAFLDFMNHDESVANELKAATKGRGRKIAYLVLAVAGVTTLLAVLVSQMSGTDVEESSAAMVEAVPQGIPAPSDAAP